MSDSVLRAVTGRELGSRPSRRLRSEGFVPATLYGKGSDPMAAALDAKELGHLVARRKVVGSILEIEIDGAKRATLVKEIQRHPVKRILLHVDLQLLDAKQAITVAVPLVALGGVELTAASIEVSGAVSSIPAAIEVSASALVDGEVLAGALALPKGVELVGDPSSVIAKVPSDSAGE